MTVTGEYCALDKKPLLEPRVFYQISSGVYIISSRKSDKFNGMIASSITQISSDPPKMIISLYKETLTHEFIQESRVFSISILSSVTPKKFIMLFGFRTGKTYDKFKEIQYKIGSSGAPIVLENTVGYLDCQVVDSLDCDLYTVFVGKVVDAELLSTTTPMTFMHYAEVLKGKVPSTAPIFACGC
jgi:flavin reductase (DIM6/NTAB) family NADH-FMN oxidoreductase RutF